MARRDEGAYLQYVTERQRSQLGWIGREIDRLSHSRAISVQGGLSREAGRRGGESEVGFFVRGARKIVLTSLPPRLPVVSLAD
jgi:hypothetical protein